MQLERTILPGVGVTFRFPTKAGKWVGVVRHNDGRRELVLYAKDDPDTVRVSVPLTPTESHQVGDLLGALDPTETAKTADGVGGGGVAITVARVRVPVGTDKPTVARLESAAAPAKIVAVVRDGQLTTGPDPTFVLTAEDLLIVVGSHDAILALQRAVAGER